MTPFRDAPGRPTGDPDTLLLTVLAHPLPEMVSSRSVVSPRLELSRNEPKFEPPGGGRLRALRDPCLSRAPILLHEDDRGGVLIDASNGPNELEVDGEPLEKTRRVDPDALVRGVVLCLRGRITLLLHRSVGESPQEDEPNLGIIGNSAPIRKIRRDLRTVAATALPVLILGESGSGKELVAQAIHDLSDRAAEHYEAINMATLTPELAASELFGHERGAFTGADAARRGCFERSDGGTLFLDEVAETPPQTQVQLLRVLETRDIRPVGGADSRTVDVRVLAATDADLMEGVERGEFRKALLHRLAGFTIEVPPLRKRLDDIGALFLHFAREQLERLGATALLEDRGSESPWISARAIARLARHDWPGNVRELRNTVRQLVVMGHRDRTITERVDLDALLGAPPRSAVKSGDTASQEASSPPSESAAAEVSEDELIRTLKRHEWRLAPTARALGISRTSLYRLVERSERVRKASDLEAPEVRRALQAAQGSVERAAAALEVSKRALTLRMRALELL